MLATETPGTEPAGRRPATQEARLAIFAEAAEILERDFSGPVRIGEVARRVATSPRQLQRVFADVGGLGFRSYLRRLRMSHAAQLLASTEIRVNEVARRVGYGDASQFSKAFKRTYGVSPSQSRAMGRGSSEQVDALPPARAVRPLSARVAVREEVTE
jgi:AraC family transcriptional regulator, regulatory protein of adaptative response / methylphosphotriester-DNA alkyltransferase methyltransferase